LGEKPVGREGPEKSGKREGVTPNQKTFSGFVVDGFIPGIY
jgi:hypothetical protein